MSTNTKRQRQRVQVELPEASKHRKGSFLAITSVDEIALLTYQFMFERDEQKLTQQELADKAGVCLGTIQRWESGATVFPRSDTRTKVARALGWELGIRRR